MFDYVGNYLEVRPMEKDELLAGERHLHALELGVRLTYTVPKTLLRERFERCIPSYRRLGNESGA